MDEQHTNELTHKKEMFALAYLKHGNATQAAIDAGYSQDRDHAHSIGSRLLKESEIKEFLEEQKSVIAARCQITFEWNLIKLKEIVDVHSVIVDRVGGQKMVDAKAVLSAMDMIAKQLGYYAPEKHEHKVKTFDPDAETLQNFIRDF